MIITGQRKHKPNLLSEVVTMITIGQLFNLTKISHYLVAMITTLNGKESMINHWLEVVIMIIG